MVRVWISVGLQLILELSRIALGHSHGQRQLGLWFLGLSEQVLDCLEPLRNDFLFNFDFVGIPQNKKP